MLAACARIVVVCQLAVPLTALYQDMGNTLMSAHRLHFGIWQSGVPESVDYRAHGPGVVVVEMSDQDVSEIDAMHAGPYRLETDPASDKRFADKSFSAPPLDFPIAADLPLFPGCWILQERSVLGHGSGAVAVPAFRHRLTQRLVRTQPAVIIDTTGGPVLLALRRRGHGPGCLRFEHPVHLFVGSVVFGMSRPGKRH